MYIIILCKRARTCRTHVTVYVVAKATRKHTNNIMAAEQAKKTVGEARATSELLVRLRESLARAADKNDSLLEAIESTEARAGEGGGSEVRGWIFHDVIGAEYHLPAALFS